MTKILKGTSGLRLMIGDLNFFSN